MEGTVAVLYKETHDASVPKNTIEKAVDDACHIKNPKMNHTKTMLKLGQNALFLNQNNR